MLHLRLHADQSGKPVALAISFDHVIQRLERLPRMFIEWDGSFVWRGGDAAVATDSSAPGLDVQSLSFQWDGEVIDTGPHVQCIALKGSGADLVPSLRAMLEQLQLSPDTLLVEEVLEGVWSNGAAFLADGPAQ